MDIGKIIIHGSAVQTSPVGIQVGSGNTASRPIANAGIIRFNTDIARLESANGIAWANIGLGDGTVSNIGLTGVTNAITVTGSPITTSGTFALSLAGELAGINALSTTGIVTRTAPGAYTAVAQLAIANGGTGATTAPAALAILARYLGWATTRR